MSNTANPGIKNDPDPSDPHNHRKDFTTRSGTGFIFDDQHGDLTLKGSQGAAGDYILIKGSDRKIEIRVGGGDNCILIDNSKGTIEISVGAGEESILLDHTKGTIDIKSNSKISLESTSGDIALNAPKGNITMNALFGINLGGKDINVKANANVEIDAVAMVTVKSALVKIN
jgi:uncharacterized protein (DUF2345 family)